MRPIIQPLVVLDAAGTASKSIPGNAIMGLTLAPVDGGSQLKVTINEVETTLPTGIGWSLDSPNGERFETPVIVEAVSGQFVLTRTS